MRRSLFWWMLLSIIVASCASPTSGQLALSTTAFDFGTVPNTKAVSHVFEVRNTGRRPVEITEISTSCGCTTAEMAESSLSPGESTALVVTYDPQAHNGATGRFMRVVYIRSTAAQTPEIQLTITVNVVESP